MSSAHLGNLFNVLRDLERQRGSRIWCMIHRGTDHICGPTIYSIYTDRDSIRRGKKIELLLHSGGGHPEYAYAVMKFFRRRFDEVNIIVPIHAKSAATLMCLGADHVYMGELAQLGPIDIQIDDPVEHGARSFSPIDEFKSIEFMRDLAIEWMTYYAVAVHHEYGTSLKEGLKDSVPLVTSLLRPLFEQIEPLEMGGNRRALAIAEEYAGRILALVGSRNAEKIVRRLVWEYPSHDFWIDFEEAGAIGIPVERLPAAQDAQLTTALIKLGKEDTYHGFAPKVRTPRTPRRTVRQPRLPRQPATTTPTGNGRDGDSTEERVQAKKASG